MFGSVLKFWPSHNYLGPPEIVLILRKLLNLGVAEQHTAPIGRGRGYAATFTLSCSWASCALDQSKSLLQPPKIMLLQKRLGHTPHQTQNRCCLGAALCPYLRSSSQGKLGHPGRIYTKTFKELSWLKRPGSDIGSSQLLVTFASA